MSENVSGDPKVTPRPRWSGGESSSEDPPERGGGDSKFLTGFLLGFLTGVLIALGVGASFAVVFGARQVRVAEQMRAAEAEARAEALEDRDRAQAVAKEREDRARVVAQEAEAARIVVKVSKVRDKVVIRVEDREVDQADLAALLAREAKARGKTSVVIDADADVPNAVVLELTDAAKKAGIDRVDLTVRNGR